MKQVSTLLAALGLVLAMSIVGVSQTGPMQPNEDHYKVYRTALQTVHPGNVQVMDQFGAYSTPELLLDHFATPVMKNQEPMLDPMRHQGWWRFFAPAPTRSVVLENQFGSQTWMVRNVSYLLTPARKETSGPPIVSNHYLCYEAQGPALNLPVNLQDQFGVVDVVATLPEMFCNPAEKMVDGVIYPREDPVAHLACYRIEPPVAYDFQVVGYDQFETYDLHLVDHEWLCVPSFKTVAVPVEPTTWGSLKTRYHD
jgi:hypothetical protein